MRIVFWGTPDIAIPSLMALADSEHTVCAVITKPPTYDPKHKKLTESPVAQSARSIGLPVHTCSDLDALRGILEQEHAQCAIVFAFGALLPAWVLTMFPYGIVNVHPSLLPKYRGPSPLQAVLLAGETETGISIMAMDEKMDHGPLYCQQSIPLAPRETLETLQEKIAHAAPSILLATLTDIEHQRISTHQQDHSKATFCKLIKKEHGAVIWHDFDAHYIERMTRALWPWPGVFTSVDQKRLLLREVRILSEMRDYPPGTLCISNDHAPCIVSKHGTLIELIRAGFAGSTMVNGADMINGHRTLFAQNKRAQ